MEEQPNKKTKKQIQMEEKQREKVRLYFYLFIFLHMISARSFVPFPYYYAAESKDGIQQSIGMCCLG